MPENKPSILVVDDESAIRLALGRIVERSGYLPLEAASNEEALAVIDAGHVPVAAICDFNMPGMTGVDLARRLRRRLPGLPVLLLSGGITEEEREAAISSGEIWAYAAKPWSLAWMREAIAAMVRGEPAPPRSDQS